MVISWQPQVEGSKVPDPSSDLMKVSAVSEVLYLDPKSKENKSPKPLKTAQKAIILHFFGASASSDSHFLLARWTSGWVNVLDGQPCRTARGNRSHSAVQPSLRYIRAIPEPISLNPKLFTSQSSPPLKGPKGTISLNPKRFASQSSSCLKGPKGTHS